MADDLSAYVNPAVLFTGPRQVAMEDRGELTPGPGQLRLRTSLSMISTGTELTLLTAELPPESVWQQLSTFPQTPGYCAVGRIDAVGDGVDAARWLGRRAVSAAWAGHARWSLAREPELDLLDDAVSDEQAVFGTINRIVMNGVRRARVGLGDSVVIVGLGLLGQLAARLAAIAGARPVICIDPAANRRACLPDDPAIVTLDPTATPDLASAVRTANHGRLADIVIELTGVAGLIPGQLAMLRPEGRFVVLSSPRGATQFDFHDLCNRHSIEIIGAHTASTPSVETPANPWTHARNCRLFQDLVAAGALDLAPLISHREPGVNAPALYELLLADRTQAMAVVLDWQG